MSVSNLAKKNMLRMEAYAKFPYLIEVTTATGTVYRFANSDEDITFNDDGTEKTFSAGWFTIQPPDIQESEIGDGTLTISALDSSWIKVIRTETKRATLRFVACIIYNDTNEIETVEPIEDTEYKLTEADWDETSISWTMVFDENMQINIPCDTGTTQKCPAVC